MTAQGLSRPALPGKHKDIFMSATMYGKPTGLKVAAACRIGRALPPLLHRYGYGSIAEKKPVDRLSEWHITID
ncbi:hypothetical protein JL100_011340 [Skermanella mucosa]|uniref:hypothetical protein n=1 Tax=Skermanella mucosa TaxID=1789672 RepID=UPI00192C62DE|nr:hypothetical protein [Skermanella mucosa]UEM23292.1 hypothetical protein JL100_011340 [Skermanella mucosa]